MICLSGLRWAFRPPATPSTRDPLATMCGWQQDWRTVVSSDTTREGGVH